MKSAEAILLPLQRKQQEHDLLAHRDILNLDTQTRLKHMTLHFLKYAGKMMQARADESISLLCSTLVDTFIICLATANALNVSVGRSLGIEARDLDELASAIDSASHPAQINAYDSALFGFLIIAGRMAKSIESTDHLERGNPRAELEELVVELTRIVLREIGALKLPLTEMIYKRWSAVEEKSIFAGLQAIS